MLQFSSVGGDGADTGGGGRAETGRSGGADGAGAGTGVFLNTLVKKF